MPFLNGVDIVCDNCGNSEALPCFMTRSQARRFYALSEGFIINSSLCFCNIQCEAEFSKSAMADYRKNKRQIKPL